MNNDQKNVNSFFEHQCTDQLFFYDTIIFYFVCTYLFVKVTFIIFVCFIYLLNVLKNINIAENKRPENKIVFEYGGNNSICFKIQLKLIQETVIDTKDCPLVSVYIRSGNIQLNFIFYPTQHLIWMVHDWIVTWVSVSFYIFQTRLSLIYKNVYVTGCNDHNRGR